jgi:hypothetical protein
MDMDMNMMADIDGGGGDAPQPQPKRARHVDAGTFDPEDPFAGPASFADIFKFADQLVARLMAQAQAAGQQSVPLASQLIGKRLVITSSYSGIGSAEWSMHFIKRALSKVGIEFEVVFYSACDCDPLCRNALANHRQPPLHIFTDIRTRISPKTYEDLEGLYVQHRTKLDEGNYESVTAKHFACSTIGWEFFEAACEYLKQVPYNRDSMGHCHVCKKHCPHVPQLEDGDLWLEIGGNTCTPWSVNGKREGWLDYNGLASLAWATWSSGARPHFILNECTPKWPGETVWQRFMGQDYDVTSFEAVQRIFTSILGHFLHIDYSALQ